MRRLHRTVYGDHKNAHAQCETAASNLAAGHVFHDPLQQGDLVRVSDQWLGVNQKTAFKMGHAIRAMMAVHVETIGLVSLNWTRSTLEASRGFNKASSIQEAREPGKPVSMSQSVTKGLPELGWSTATATRLWRRISNKSFLPRRES